ncbi:hypothetical protein HDE_13456 [Halotydeus destructor]|nr:hypothetical protein HDE_13456 [Halotydeus destructor]
MEINETLPASVSDTKSDEDNVHLIELFRKRLKLIKFIAITVITIDALFAVVTYLLFRKQNEFRIKDTKKLEDFLVSTFKTLAILSYGKNLMTVTVTKISWNVILIILTFYQRTKLLKWAILVQTIMATIVAGMAVIGVTLLWAQFILDLALLIALMQTVWLITEVRVTLGNESSDSSVRTIDSMTNTRVDDLPPKSRNHYRKMMLTVAIVLLILKMIFVNLTVQFAILTHGTTRSTPFSRLEVWLTMVVDVTESIYILRNNILPMKNVLTERRSYEKLISTLYSKEKFYILVNVLRIVYLLTFKIRVTENSTFELITTGVAVTFCTLFTVLDILKRKNIKNVLILTTQSHLSKLRRTREEDFKIEGLMRMYNNRIFSPIPGYFNTWLLGSVFWITVLLLATLLLELFRNKLKPVQNVRQDNHQCDNHE